MRLLLVENTPEFTFALYEMADDVLQLRRWMKDAPEDEGEVITVTRRTLQDAMERCNLKRMQEVV